MSDPVTLDKLTVLVLSRDEASVAIVKAGLPQDCLIIGFHALSVAEVLIELERCNPDVIAISAPTSEPDILTLAERILAVRPLPILIFVKDDLAGLAGLAVRVGVSSFVVDGLSVQRVGSLIVVARERFKMARALEDELQKSKENLAARKTVERAKGLLMKARGLDEQQAYEALRSMAMRQGKSIKSVCEAVIAMSDLLP